MSIGWDHQLCWYPLIWGTNDVIAISSNYINWIVPRNKTNHVWCAPCSPSNLQTSFKQFHLIAFRESKNRTNINRAITAASLACRHSHSQPHRFTAQSFRTLFFGTKIPSSSSFIQVFACTCTAAHSQSFLATNDCIMIFLFSSIHHVERNNGSSIVQLPPHIYYTHVDTCEAIYL